MSEQTDAKPTRREVISAAAVGIVTTVATQAIGAAATSPTTQRANNDATRLVPKTSFEGPELKFDFPGFAIGCAEYDEGPTGCTVFRFAKSALAVADIRGGAHCTIFTDYLAETACGVDAICLAGGSFYGLEAATGAASELFAQTGYATNFNKIALVTGAIVYDFHSRDTAVYPDKELGRAAIRSAVEGRFPLGRRGAGRSVGCGGWNWPNFRGEPSGQGAAFGQIGQTKLAAFTVVNAMGCIVDRAGNVVRGSLDPKTGKRVHPRDVVIADSKAEPRKGNTTLTVLITNREMGEFSLRQLARQVHSSMSRAITPFHTSGDGDVLFAATTRAVKEDTPNNDRLGIIASELAWDAVLRCYES